MMNDLWKMKTVIFLQSAVHVYWCKLNGCVCVCVKQKLILSRNCAHRYNTTEQTQPQSPSTEDSVRYLNTVWSGARSVQCASNGLDWWPLICRLWQQPRDSGPTLGSCRRNCTCGNEILVASPHNIDQVRLLTHTCSKIANSMPANTYTLANI